MENVLQRLKKEYSDLLDQADDEFPVTVRDIKEDLKNNISINEVKYGTFLCLRQTIGINKDSFFDYFNN